LWDKKTVIIKEKTKERVNEFLKRKEKAKLTLKGLVHVFTKQF